MDQNNTKDERQKTAKSFSWKVIIVFLIMPILLNFIFVLLVLSHFNTFNGAPLSEMMANITLYVGNWPSFLLRQYPYVIAGGGEVVYEALEWTNPITFIINLIGWELFGFLCSYVNRRRKRLAHNV